MRAPILFAAVLCACAAGLVAAAGMPQAKKPPKVAAPAPISKDVESQITKLEKEFAEASQKYQAELDAAKAAKKPQGEWPKPPHAKFFEHYGKLAEKGEPRAARWCLNFIDKMEGTDTARAALFTRAEAALVPHALWNDHLSTLPDPAPVTIGVKDLIGPIVANAKLLGDVTSLAMCDELFQGAEAKESKAQALFGQASIKQGQLERGAKPSDDMLALYKRLSQDFADTTPGKRATGQLFKLENLQLGCTPPDFVTKDVEDVEFKLSDYRGKVVVLDFWGFW